MESVESVGSVESVESAEVRVALAVVEGFEVLDGGLLTTVQDGGRYGWARYGIPPSGPVDGWALRAANALVGNAPEAAGLEITLTGPVLRALRPLTVALCGAVFDVRRNGVAEVPFNQSLSLRAGDVLTFKERRWGARAYLAVRGGLALPLFLGSQSTYLPGAFGGLAGRALQAGDRLPVYAAPPLEEERAWPAHALPPYTPAPVLRVIRGPQAEGFSATGWATFLSAVYTVSAKADRMGARLQGPPIEKATVGDMLSDGVVMGSVQVPPDGQPIVMLADHQTTGGYPKIATVIRADLPLLAQCLPGDTVRFVETDVATARAAWRKLVTARPMVLESEPWGAI